MVDYQNSKIYKIVCNITGETYYGSTTRPLKIRIRHHETQLTSTSRHIINRGNYYYELLEEYPCENKEQLHQRERIYIENNPCINRQTPTRTSQEYRQDNIEHIKEVDRLKHINDRENRNARCKKWYEDHKDEILEREKETMICECGCEIRKKGLRNHLKTPKHKELMEANN
tara:strand:+ start:762 stop:1277 length:516 start_codon:yes stop_codon:yes gene_type:complete